MDVALEEFEMENAALKDNTCGNKACWVIKLEEELRRDVKSSGRSSPVVFSVPKVLLASYQQFYIPSLISVGPYHFDRAEFSNMESHKIEAVRRMQQRIHGRSMHSIVETEILAMTNSIRGFYDKELSHSAIDLAWMVTKDSCFLFEFMLNYVRTCRGKLDFHNDCVVEGSYDAVLSTPFKNSTSTNILYDHSLLENQIPLSVLQFLLTTVYLKSDPEKILGDILNRVSNQGSLIIFGWGMPQPYKKEKTLHFLEVLYYRHVGWDLACYTREAYSFRDRQFLHLNWWTKSIFPNCSIRWQMRGRGMEDHVHPSKLKLPSAAELKKKGVNFCAVTHMNIEGVENRQGIRWIRFEEKTSTLYFPDVRIDVFRHALLRNFIAMENTSEKYRPWPMTSFAFFMDELVDSEEDVAVLREANIIKNFFGSNKEAVECFNALTMSYHKTRGCKPIDDARAGLHKYLRRKYRILWHEFTSTYFAKPWVVVGSVAASLLLLMTMLQVFCLFYICNRRT